MLLNVHEDPNNVYLTRLKLTHVEPQGGGGAVFFFEFSLGGDFPT